VAVAVRVAVAVGVRVAVAVGVRVVVAVGVRVGVGVIVRVAVGVAVLVGVAVGVAPVATTKIAKTPKALTIFSRKCDRTTFRALVERVSSPIIAYSATGKLVGYPSLPFDSNA